MDSTESGKASNGGSACDKRSLDSVMRHLVHAKQARRRELARLPFEQKIRIVVELQKIAHEIGTQSGRNAPSVWRIADDV